MTSSPNTPESSSNNTTTTTTTTSSSNPPLPSHVHHTPPRPGLLRPGDTPVNILPGGTAHTANPDVSSSSKARSQDYSIVDAAKTIKLSDYKTIHTKPCVRDALMTGIVASVGAGGAGVVMGRELTFSLQFFFSHLYIYMRKLNQLTNFFPHRTRLSSRKLGRILLLCFLLRCVSVLLDE